MGEVRRDDGKRNMFWRSARSWPAPTPVHNAQRRQITETRPLSHTSVSNSLFAKSKRKRQALYKRHVTIHHLKERVMRGALILRRRPAIPK